MLTAHGGTGLEPGFWAFALEWPFEPLVWVAVAVCAWAYLRACARVPGWPAVRRTHFMLGLGAVAAALASPLAPYADALLSIHMVQHLLLTLVAAPLILLGAPVSLAVRVFAPRARRRLASALHARPLRAVAHPVAAWCGLVAAMWASHFSGLYDLALENAAVHVLEHGLYLATALLFWWPVIGLDPGARRLAPPVRIGYLALALPPQSFLGLAVYSAERVLYRHYETLATPWSVTPLDDQRAAGIIMWVGGDALLVAALVLLVLTWMRHDLREAERLDRRLGLPR